MRNILSFLLGFTLTIAVLGTLTLLMGCGSNNTSNSGSVPTPSVGQWVDYGGAEPTITGNTFAFPVGSGNIVAGYFYTTLPYTPQMGKTLTINYTITGINPIWQNAANGGDSGAPTLHLFLWRRGDDESCAGVYADYRLFGGRTPLVLGANQTISVPLDAAHWTGCYAAPPANISDELNNLLGAGFTFGGQYFAGHGIYLSSGSAQFTINSFTVQ